MLDEIIMKHAQENIPRKSGVYGIRNLINNKLYVGSSKNLKKRIIAHKCGLNKNKHPNEYLQKSYNKYGLHNFLFFTIELCDTAKLYEREQYFIDLYQSIDNGYNLKRVDTGKDGFVYSKKTREKMSECNRIRYRNNPVTVCKYGHLYTEENTIMRKSGFKTCRTCHILYTEKRNRLSKEERAKNRKISEYCKNGHLKSENQFVSNFGKNICRACDKDRKTKWYLKSRGNK